MDKKCNQTNPRTSKFPRSNSGKIIPHKKIVAKGTQKIAL